MKGNNFIDSVKGQSVEWKFSTYKLITLLDMLQFNAQRFCNLSQTLELYATTIEKYIELDANELPKDLIPILKNILRDCEAMKLTSSTAKVNRMITLAQSEYHLPTAVTDLRELNSRISDELGGRYFLEPVWKLNLQAFEHQDRH